MNEAVEQLAVIFEGALTMAVQRNMFPWCYGLTEKDDIPSLALFLAETLRGSTLLKATPEPESEKSKHTHPPKFGDVQGDMVYGRRGWRQLGQYDG